MTRKDTILVAVVINAGLLAILFATAIIYDDTNKEVEQTELLTSLGEPKSHAEDSNPSLIAVASPGDEVDNVLRHYQKPNLTRPILIEMPTAEVYVPEPVTVQAYHREEEEASFDLTGQTHYMDVTVKKGDSLDKIARVNHTTVSAIKKVNRLQNERLSIGQVLKVPMKRELSSPLVIVANAPVVIPAPRQEAESSSPVYYSVKSGDSPWKIAKQFNVNYEDILKLNQLDEEKARNLKIGDRIRVR